MSKIEQDTGDYPCHQCAPRDWRNVPIMTGDYDFDATIMHRKNPDMIGRLELYVRPRRGAAYRYVTNYDAYEKGGE